MLTAAWRTGHTEGMATRKGQNSVNSSAQAGVGDGRQVQELLLADDEERLALLASRPV